MADIGKLVQMMGGVDSIDWNALARQGKDTIFNSEYILDYLFPATQRALQVLDTLQFEPQTPDELVKVWKLMHGDIGEYVGYASRAFALGLSTVMPGQEYTVPSSDLRALATYCYIAIINGTIMHRDQTMIYALAAQHPDGQLTEKDQRDIMEHANWVTGLGNVVVKLDQLGVWKPLKKPGMGAIAPVGLGALPVVALVIIAIAAIAALAWVISAIAEISAREATVYATCKTAAEKGDSAGLQACRDLAQATPSPSSDLAKTIMLVVGAGAAAYALIAFGPSIAKSLRESLSSKAGA